MPYILCTLLTHATYKFLLNIPKRGCVFPLVIWPAFRMEHNRVNGHPYHAPQFIIQSKLYETYNMFHIDNMIFYVTYYILYRRNIVGDEMWQ